MRPITEIEGTTTRGLRGLLTDIDGTLTDDGRLSASAYAALWRARESDLLVVPVTGRPAGWCDLIARQWPVDGVVGENGALAYWADGERLHRLTHPNAGDTERLREVERAVLREVPGSRVAADQPYRRFDLAIDFCEDPPDLGLEAAEQIRAVFERFGAHAKISNIHVNGWFGDYDKLSMVRAFVRERWALDVDDPREAARWIFCGDSPNDEPMFAHFPNACGVANVRPFLDRMRHPPAFVARAEGGAGFSEIVDAVLRGRDGA